MHHLIIPCGHMLMGDLLCLIPIWRDIGILGLKYGQRLCPILKEGVQRICKRDMANHCGVIDPQQRNMIGNHLAIFLTDDGRQRKCLDDLLYFILPDIFKMRGVIHRLPAQSMITIWPMLAETSARPKPAFLKMLWSDLRRYRSCMSACQSCGPAATSARPASVSVNLVKFSTNRPARSCARSCQMAVSS